MNFGGLAASRLNDHISNESHRSQSPMTPSAGARHTSMMSPRRMRRGGGNKMGLKGMRGKSRRNLGINKRTVGMNKKLNNLGMRRKPDMGKVKNNPSVSFSNNTSVNLNTGGNNTPTLGLPQTSPSIGSLDGTMSITTPSPMDNQKMDNTQVNIEELVVNTLENIESNTTLKEQNTVSPDPPDDHDIDILNGVGMNGMDSKQRGPIKQVQRINVDNGHLTDDLMEDKLYESGTEYEDTVKMDKSIGLNSDANSMNSFVTETNDEVLSNQLNTNFSESAEV